jgi:hypothetical protein
MTLKNTTGKFLEFDEANPQVWIAFKRFTFQAINTGRKRFGAKMVVERIRWDTLLTTTDERYKISNDYTAFYARKFVSEFPQYKGLFVTKPSMADRLYDEAA